MLMSMLRPRASRPPAVMDSRWLRSAVAGTMLIQVSGLGPEEFVVDVLIENLAQVARGAGGEVQLVDLREGVKVRP